MKIARFSAAGATSLGIVEGQFLTVLTGRVNGLSSDMLELISHWDELEPLVRALPRTADLRVGEVKLLSPVSRPGKVLGIGLNYDDHVAESGLKMPEFQTWFAKAVTSITGPYDSIQLPKASSSLDYEGELVFIVGKGGKHVSKSAADAAIFGYCVGDDVSVRDWQFRSGQFTLGKSFDTHAPIGPWIVTADSIDARNLAIRTFVNGEKRQESNTQHLIFDCAAQVAHLTEAMTLEPGDVIFTGTPSGVGVAMKPPKFLAVGDRVRIEIDGIGSIENEVAPEA
jgi:ureidoglycolate lyase